MLRWRLEITKCSLRENIAIKTGDELASMDRMLEGFQKAKLNYVATHDNPDSSVK